MIYHPLRTRRVQSFDTVFNPLPTTLALESKCMTSSLEASMTLRVTHEHANMPPIFRAIDSVRRLNTVRIRSCKILDT
nr:hypothetical protein GZ17F1_16 [uncultured archaeon GZfos17F1]